MDFGDVIKAMKKDSTKKFARKGWNGKGMYIQLQVPDENSKMTLPYIYMKTAQGDLVPWLASQTDILADNDWIEIAQTRIDTTWGLCAHVMKEIQDYKYDNQPNPRKDDSVHNPAHYCKDRKYQPWDVITDWELDFLLGNAVKYIARAGHKQQTDMTMRQAEEQDLLKAIEYLQKRLEVIKGER